MLSFTLAFFAEKISKSDGIDISNASLELLLRHRAVLFGIVGTLTLYSAIMKLHYSLSTTVGVISVVSFIVLYYQIGQVNKELKTVMIIYVVASIVLLVAGILFFITSKNK